MKADDLLKRIIEHGADEGGIADRFSGDAELYKVCFDEFMSEPNFDLLKKAMAEKEYGEAFKAAHALKGLAGNLGISPFYTAIHTLVESLRSDDHSGAEAAYDEVMREKRRLALLASGRSPDNEAIAKRTPAKKPPKKRDKTMLAVLFMLLATIATIGFLFITIIGDYQRNTSVESANHLIELNHQVKLYMEGKIAADWRTAYSLADTVADGDFIKNDEAVFELMRRKKVIWNVTDIRIYTENGYSVSAEGAVEYNTFASDTIAHVKADGEYATISESNVIYAVPVNTPIHYNGSRIVAVSVAQSMATLLDDMGFESFHGTAALYLTMGDGVVVSKLSENTAETVYNISVVTDGMEIGTPSGGDASAADLHKGSQARAFTLNGEGGSYYFISTPIETRLVPLWLFYNVPKDMVDKIAGSFSSQLIIVSMVMIACFAVIAVIVFYLIYKTRKRQFDEQLVARDSMTDHLVKHTNTAFGLFNTSEQTPRYISSNSIELLGDEGWTLNRGEDGYYWRDSSGNANAIIDRVNETMRGWDGKGEFKSGYIVNDEVTPPKYFEIRLYPAGDNGTDYIGMAIDVTDAHKREDTVHSALLQAKDANAAKSMFLSNMSHDIRTPMNAIVNMAEFAKESIGSPKEQSGYLDTIIESSNHLLNLINDILDMSRIDSGKLIIASEPFNPESVIATQCDIIRTLCETKHITFIADFGSIRTHAVLGDELKLSQIVANLLSNALKFTPQGGAIRITVSELPAASDETTMLRIVVEDTGCGISADFLPYIFDAFSRADKKRVSRIEGSGLGLSICKSYVEAMGGTIQCESEKGEGSTFTVELCLAKTDKVRDEDVAPPVHDSMTFVGLHCLVAEDIATNQKIAKMMLERLGFTVDIAEDGREAVYMFTGSKPNGYDVIYMDIQMPVMDGYKAAAAIRGSTHPRAKTVPIIAMTANVFNEDARKAREAGMNGHIGKPVQTNELVRITKKALAEGKDLDT